MKTCKFNEIEPLNPPLKTIIEGMPFDAYTRAHKGKALRASELREAAKSAAHFRCARENASKSTPDMMLGTMAHMAVLEPDKFAQLDASRLTRLAERHAYNAAQQIAEAVQAHETAKQLLLDERLHREASIFWQDRFTGMLCKARLDVVAPTMTIDGLEQGYILDFKTTRDCTPYAFSNECLRLHYALQLAHYAEAALACGAIAHDDAPWFIVAAEKTPPFAMIAWDVTPWQDFGHRWRKQALATAVQAIESGNYPGYNVDMQVLEPPSWAPGATDVEFCAARQPHS